MVEETSRYDRDHMAPQTILSPSPATACTLPSPRPRRDGRSPGSFGEAGGVRDAWPFRRVGRPGRMRGPAGPCPLGGGAERSACGATRTEPAATHPETSARAHAAPADGRVKRIRKDAVRSAGGEPIHKQSEGSPPALRCPSAAGRDPPGEAPRGTGHSRGASRRRARPRA